jgi:hypothetical protein
MRKHIQDKSDGTHCTECIQYISAKKSDSKPERLRIHEEISSDRTRTLVDFRIENETHSDTRDATSCGCSGVDITSSSDLEGNKKICFSISCSLSFVKLERKILI